MIVKVKPGYSIYREGYIREVEDGPFRLYKVPPAPKGTPEFDKWLGEALEEVSDYEAQQFEHDESRNVDFSETVAGQDYEQALGRAGLISQAVSALDQRNDNHWTKEGLPRLDAVEELSNLPNVKRTEVNAVCPDVRRAPEDQRKTPARGRVRADS